MAVLASWGTRPLDGANSLAIHNLHPIPAAHPSASQQQHCLGLMVVKEVTVSNRAGIHTRPASMIVREASRFSSDFFIQKDGYEINGKSIIGVMTLAAEQGATLSLVFDGSDENEAADALVNLFDSGFGEVK